MHWNATRKSNRTLSLESACGWKFTSAIALSRSGGEIEVISSGGVTYSLRVGPACARALPPLKSTTAQDAAECGVDLLFAVRRIKVNSLTAMEDQKPIVSWKMDQEGREREPCSRL